uniref:Calicivirus coat protein domain-containing protein n=1 Tax=Suncus murinus ribovirus 1 TaxID=3139575 RepID=A0AB38ZKD0_9VIRU
MAGNNVSNAPIPNSSGGAAEEFDSTITPPTGNLSSIGIDMTDNTEVPARSGMVNVIDTFFRSNYVSKALFEWNTEQHPGTLLWSAKVHPMDSHQWIEYVAKMYNTWGGGFDYAFKVAGTAFHAGQIVFARLPPNIKPESIKTTADITAFECYYIDPKCLEVNVKEVMDQRNIMYHWMDTKLDPDNPNSFGGYIACYVFIPLVTSSTGVQNINIQCWIKASQNFQFSQIRPLGGSGPIPINNVKLLVESYLDFHGQYLIPFNFGNSDSLNANANTVTTLTTTNVVQADGKYYSNLTSYDNYPNIFLVSNGYFETPSTWKKKVGADGWAGFEGYAKGDEIKIFPKNKDTGPVMCAPAGTQFDLIFQMRKSKQDGKSPPLISLRVSLKDITLQGIVFQFEDIGTYDPYHIFKKEEVIDWDDGVDFKTGSWNYLIYARNFASINDVKTFSPPLRETILCGDAAYYGYQIASVKHLFSTQALKDDLKQGQCIFLEMWDVVANVPISKAKLYFEGFITVPEVKTNVTWKPEKIKFTFLRIGPANTPMFNDHKMLKNQMYSDQLSEYIEFKENGRNRSSSSSRSSRS